MGKAKGAAKKQQKRGVDFKKIKRKIGRKLPPPKNATNTEIKSKAIILPEQSLAADKAGLALSKKGLTLKELLQQTSHYSPKVRKDGLLGLKDLFAKHPEELKSYRYQVIEKLRERISDDDKMVRETLYQLFKSVILPGCKEDDQGIFISLMMVYIFNAMTHLAIEVRLMAFKFFDLVVQLYPPVFSMYSEKILQNYGDILRKNQFYLEDKGRLKNVLAGLIHCLSLLPSKKVEANSFEKKIPQLGVLHAFEPDMVTESTEFAVIINKLKDFLPILVDCFQDFIPLIHSLPMLDGQSFDCMVSILQSIDLVVRYFVSGSDKINIDSHLSMWDQVISSVLLKKLFAKFPVNPVHHLSVKDSEKYFILNVRIAEILFHLNERLHLAADLLEKFLAFLENALLGKVCSDTKSGRAVREKQILALVPFIPKLIAQLIGPWRSRLLEAFTKTFLEFNPESPVKLACVSAIEEMLFSGEGMLYPDECDSELWNHQITWMRELPLLLILLGERHSSSSQILLHLLLRLGQCSITNSFLALEYDNIQQSLQKLYSSYEGNLCYGPFIKLSRDCQELAICCLYYFSHLDSPLLKSVVSCCLCHELDPFILFRIIEVLHSSYKAGRIQISDHISFFMTLVSGFKVPPSAEEDTKLMNLGTFKSLSNVLCTYLLEMGDNSLVFLILEKVIMEQILLMPAVDNACAMLRMLVTVDSKPTKLSEQSIITLSKFLAEYLIDVMHCVPENEATSSLAFRQQRYYALPCFFLFDRSLDLLNLVLKVMVMGSLKVDGSSLLSMNDNRSTTGQLRRINAIVSVLQMMHSDSKMKQCLSSSRTELNLISQRIFSLQSSEQSNLSVGERHRIQQALDQLNTIKS